MRKQGRGRYGWGCHGDILPGGGGAPHPGGPGGGGPPVGTMPGGIFDCNKTTRHQAWPICVIAAEPVDKNFLKQTKYTG
jgi:hypothetical protein